MSDKRGINIWTLFANGCSLLCKRSISIKDLEEWHNVFKLVCNPVKKGYDQKIGVPNMHLMLDIKECVLIYGPVDAIWCFGFERFDDVMGKYHVDNGVY